MFGGVYIPVMSKQYTPAQKKAYAIKMAKQAKPKKAARARPIPRAPAIKGHGKYTFSSAGSDIGRGLGYGLDYIMGRGDYTVRANSVMGGVYDPPELHNRSDRTVCIRHREYLGDISASAAFTLQSYSINPGLVNSFPWLSQVAEAFEEYRFTGIVFEFKTLSADYTTASSAALGYVIMSTQYNVLSPDFGDKITMENYEFSNSGKPSSTFLHPVECKRSLNPVSELFVRTGAVTTGDLRLYDHGKFQIATGGNSGSGVLGELWCTFEVEFYKPKLISSLGTQLLADHWKFTGASLESPLGATTQVLQAGSNLGTIINGGQITFPAAIEQGSFLITYSVVGGATTSVAPPVPPSTNSSCFFQPVWEASPQAYESTSNTTSKSIVLGLLIIVATGAVVTFDTGHVVPLTNSGDIWITQVNPNIVT